MTTDCLVSGLDLIYVPSPRSNKLLSVSVTQLGGRSSAMHEWNKEREFAKV